PRERDRSAARASSGTASTRPATAATTRSCRCRPERQGDGTDYGTRAGELRSHSMHANPASRRPSAWSSGPVGRVVQRVGEDRGMPDAAASGPAELDPIAYLTDGDAELQRCASQHWWARGVDQHGQPMPIVLGWEANRATLS